MSKESILKCSRGIDKVWADGSAGRSPENFTKNLVQKILRRNHDAKLIQARQLLEIGLDLESIEKILNFNSSVYQNKGG